MRPYFLYLDDARDPFNSKVKWPERVYSLEPVIVRNYTEFIEKLQLYGLPEIVSFDFDLCTEHYRCGSLARFQSLAHYRTLKDTGAGCAKFLIDYCKKHKKSLPVYYCHSANSAGRQYILKLLNDFKAIQEKELKKEVNQDGKD